MLVRDALPPEVVVVVRTQPWSDHGTSGGKEQVGVGTGLGAGAGAGSSDEPALVFSIYRADFLQEGPSGE